MDPVTIALAIGGAIAAPVLATAILFKCAPQLLEKSEEPAPVPVAELGEPKEKTPWRMEEGDDIVCLTAPEGSKYYLEDGSWYDEEGDELDGEELDNQHGALERAKRLEASKRAEEKLRPDPGVGFFTREHGRTLYVDERGNGFRFTQDDKGHQKWVRYPSGADIADQLEHQRIFDRWHQWSKLNHDNNKLLNEQPPPPKIGFSKSADDQWIVYVDQEGQEYRRSVDAHYDFSWYLFPDGDKVDERLSLKLNDLHTEHTETTLAELRRKKWTAEAGS